MGEPGRNGSAGREEGEGPNTKRFACRACTAVGDTDGAQKCACFVPAKRRMSSFLRFCGFCSPH
jgi:hypothetical protein